MHDFKGIQPVSISVSFCDLGVELYTQDLVKFLGRRLFLDIFFKMAGSGLAPASEGVLSFIHCFVERVEILHMFIHSDRVEILYCFVWKNWEPGNMSFLEMAMSLLCGFHLFMLCWARYHTDLEQMSKTKRQNIRPSAWRSSLSSFRNCLYKPNDIFKVHVV